MIHLASPSPFSHAAPGTAASLIAMARALPAKNGRAAA